MGSRQNWRKPHIQTCDINLNKCGPIVLNASMKIKNEMDSTLTFRRSYREGVYGSCAMYINEATLELAPKEVTPTTKRSQNLPSSTCVCDQRSCSWFEQLLCSAQIHWALFEEEGWIPGRQTALCDSIMCNTQEIGRNWMGCRSASSVSAAAAACCSYWGNEDKYLGPVVLMQAHHWVSGSRDDATEKHLARQQGSFCLDRCHTIMNCRSTHSQGLNPGKAVAEIKKLMATCQEKKVSA